MRTAAAAVTEACKESREDAQEGASIPRGRVRELFTKGSDRGGVQAEQSWARSRGRPRSTDTEAQSVTNSSARA